MANNYFDATGVLVLSKVTPVITALFGGFNLDPNIPGNGSAYISHMSESNQPDWDDICDKLEELVVEKGLSVPDAPCIEDYLASLASHFGADENEVICDLIEKFSFSGSAELSVLFDIALCFDDGHGLKAMKIEGCWHCDKPRLFEFGGHGDYRGRHIRMSSQSSTTLNVGESVDEALEAGDPTKAAGCLLKQVEGLLAGITDNEVRATLRGLVGSGLMALAAEATR
ncbi:hypothetical protein K2O51_31175 (plasmid) [Cupriavidus pinatubonensis]|uniref:hypothetical protein n=1 Tax=Cupriavidus pinatubonensis TaxID=248026 RepID=UPI001C7366EC|nr:hypothetical protein [Cupriavidus pinatubonensis]QYY33709.1 hypothetical protein K2O51_31175 [Cupriavidus pinatubonensis]